MKFAAAVILATLMLFTFSAQAQYARADPYETAVTQIQKAMSPNSNGVQHFRWVSLRLLADPAMNPLFETLAAKKDVPLRIDGFMGIALVSADKSLDATRVIQLKDPALRTLLITEALGLELLKPAALNGFLQAPDLKNYERTLLVAELNRQGQPWDPSLLINAPTDDGAEVAGLACMLLLERGDQSAWKNLLVKYNTLPPADQTDLVRQLANAARQYRITAAAAPLASALRGMLAAASLAEAEAFFFREGGQEAKAAAAIAVAALGIAGGTPGGAPPPTASASISAAAAAEAEALPEATSAATRGLSSLPQVAASAKAPPAS